MTIPLHCIVAFHGQHMLIAASADLLIRDTNQYFKGQLSTGRLSKSLIQLGQTLAVYTCTVTSQAVSCLSL